MTIIIWFIYHLSYFVLSFSQAGIPFLCSVMCTYVVFQWRMREKKQALLCVYTWKKSKYLIILLEKNDRIERKQIKIIRSLSDTGWFCMFSL